MTTRFDIINANLPSDLRTKAGRKAAALASIALLTDDECCARHTAMRTIAEIAACTLRDGYRPTLLTRPSSSKVPDLRRAFLAERVADAYDAHMKSLGRPERAWRGSR